MNKFSITLFFFAAFGWFVYAIVDAARHLGTDVWIDMWMAAFFLVLALVRVRERRSI